MPTTTVPTTTTDHAADDPVPTTTTALPPQPKLIAAGVTIGGTLVGGLTAAEASEVVRDRFARPLTLASGRGARIVVTPEELGAASQIEMRGEARSPRQAAAFVVPLKVEVSQAEGRTPRRLPRQALSP